MEGMTLSCEGIVEQHQSRAFPSHRALSYTKRFLAIGSLLRRLDIFVNDLRRRYVIYREWMNHQN